LHTGKYLLLSTKTLAEFLNLATSIHNLGLAGIERMALGTYVDVVRLIATCGTGVEAVTTAASDVHFFVFGCISGFMLSL